MKAPDRKPEVIDAQSLNKYLMGVATQIKTKEISVDEAMAISKVADKIVKLNLIRLMYNKTRNQDSEIDFFEGVESTTLLTKVG